TSTLPYDSPPRVTSLAADEGNLQHKLNKLIDLCTLLQRQQTEMASKIIAQDLEIASLKARIKLLEDTDGEGTEPSGEDATIKGKSLEIREEVERIELINDLVKYQDNYAKVLKYQTQQRKPLSKKQQREFYMLVLKSHSGWKTKHFKGMSLEEIIEKFVLVWKQIEDFIPMGSKEEGERFKRKGLSLEQDSAKKVKTSEEVLEEDLKTMMQLVPVEEVYVEAL
nr:hypothetical protein [Tanacetum cinerariifolium]GFB49057.1 hypothetical protein [Tanacetum cinerariifolium]